MLIEEALVHRMCTRFPTKLATEDVLPDLKSVSIKADNILTDGKYACMGSQERKKETLKAVCLKCSKLSKEKNQSYKEEKEKKFRIQK